MRAAGSIKLEFDDSVQTGGGLKGGEYDCFDRK